MANVNNVIKLIRPNDIRVRLSVFDNSCETTPPEELYMSWLKKIRLNLGNCVFTNNFCILSIYTPDETFQPIPIDSTDTVVGIIQECFDAPKTLRLDITTPHDTTFSWIFALSSDLTWRYDTGG